MSLTGSPFLSTVFSVEYGHERRLSTAFSVDGGGPSELPGRGEAEANAVVSRLDERRPLGAKSVTRVCSSRGARCVNRTHDPRADTAGYQNRAHCATRPLRTRIARLGIEKGEGAAIDHVDEGA